MNKQSKDYLEHCSFLSIFGTETCYTDDWIPVFISNQMMTIKADKITRDYSGPKGIFIVPDNISESQIMQDGEMPDIRKLMEEAINLLNELDSPSRLREITDYYGQQTQIANALIKEGNTRKPAMYTRV